MVRGKRTQKLPDRQAAVRIASRLIGNTECRKNRSERPKRIDARYSLHAPLTPQHTLAEEGKGGSQNSIYKYELNALSINILRQTPRNQSSKGRVKTNLKSIAVRINCGEPSWMPTCSVFIPGRKSNGAAQARCFAADSWRERMATQSMQSVAVLRQTCTTATHNQGSKRFGSRGNIEVLRMLGKLRKSMTTRSMPIPAPAWGYAPYLKASM